MPQTVSIGNASFESIRRENCFYIDKTSFIREWWEKKDVATLIMRPRRFGKTLNMSMLNCFFSNRYQNQLELFEGLEIWKDETYRRLQGTYPVIFLSFASVKANSYENAKKQINAQICRVYEENRFLLDGELLSENEKEQFQSVKIDMDDALSSMALHELSCYLNRYYKKNVIILLDEYDTPMQEAYLYAYWNDFTSFVRNFFNATFKTNPYLERALMTGITRVSKESVFSDLNNLNVVTVTSDEYATAFGFTEKEVFDALDEAGLSEEKVLVKSWYDGFVFGQCKDMYNPWSITNFLDKRELQAYWADTSSNRLVGRLIQTASGEIKEKMELLLEGTTVIENFDEQIVFEQLDHNESAIWSLLLASGYLKAVEIEYRGIYRKPWFHLAITNMETEGMFAGMFRGWFSAAASNYNGFVKAMLSDDKKAMNYYMNKVALSTFSFFDTGKHASQNSEPERFYHGFVLGLIAELSDEYEIHSNRESGFGRYDVMMIPRDVSVSKKPAIIMEFKVHDAESEQSLKDTVKAALAQIEEKAYDAELTGRGIASENIRHYGFAFEGKKVLIG